MTKKKLNEPIHIQSVIQNIKAIIIKVALLMQANIDDTYKHYSNDNDND